MMIKRFATCLMLSSVLAAGMAHADGNWHGHGGGGHGGGSHGGGWHGGGGWRGHGGWRGGGGWHGGRGGWRGDGWAGAALGAVVVGGLLGDMFAPQVPVYAPLPVYSPPGYIPPGYAPQPYYGYPGDDNDEQ